MRGWQGPLSPSFLCRLHMQFLAAFPTPLQTEQQTLYKATLPGGAETHNLFFIQAVSLQEAGSQASDYSFNVCLLHTVSMGNTTLYLQTSLPTHWRDSLLSSYQPCQRHNQILMILPVKSHCIYSWSALRTKKINFVLSHERAGSQLTSIDTPITVWCLWYVSL